MEKNNEVEVINTSEAINPVEADVSAQESTTSSEIEAAAPQGKKGKKEKPVLSKKDKKKKTVNTIVNVVLVVAIVLAAICTYMSFVATS
ncbi:MAG: hypothetical protein IKY62_02085, partial [Clostridia bacterium]|nr:hypothetical protein [Clostridia bacterium]